MLEVKKMVFEMVIDVVDSIEAVASSIIESIIGTSYEEGEVMAVWRRIESNAAIKSRIKKKLEEENNEERLLVEAQGTAERMMRQEVARNRSLSGREEKALNDLPASLNNLTGAEVDTELKEDV